MGDIMSKKEEFKEFVRKNPRLITFVKNGEMTWQKFYEIYDIYGENTDAWKNYLEVATTTGVTTSLLDILKNIDLDNVQNGVNSIQRVLGVLQDMTGNKKTESQEYKPRPIYKSFDD